MIILIPLLFSGKNSFIIWKNYVCQTIKNNLVPLLHQVSIQATNYLLYHIHFKKSPGLGTSSFLDAWIDSQSRRIETHWSKHGNHSVVEPLHFGMQYLQEWSYQPQLYPSMKSPSVWLWMVLQPAYLQVPSFGSRYPQVHLLQRNGEHSPTNRYLRLWLLVDIPFSQKIITHKSSNDRYLYSTRKEWKTKKCLPALFLLFSCFQTRLGSTSHNMFLITLTSLFIWCLSSLWYLVNQLQHVNKN